MRAAHQRVAHGVDPHSALLTRLHTQFERHGISPRLADSRSERWFSATFEGTRHRYGFRLAQESDHAALAQLQAEICEADFALPGHIVADIALVPGDESGDGFTIEALTVEAA